MTRIAETIRELRLAKGITQKDLANAIGVAKSVVYYWENAVNEPKASYILALANFFEISVDYLLGNTDEWGNELNGNINPPPSLSAEQQEILELYDKLTPKDRQRIHTALEIYAEATEAERLQTKKRLEK